VLTTVVGGGIGCFIEFGGELDIGQQQIWVQFEGMMREACGTWICTGDRASPRAMSAELVTSCLFSVVAAQLGCVQ